MIHVDIFAAFCGKSYEFCCDRDVSVGIIKEQLVEALLRIEGIRESIPQEILADLRLYSIDRAGIISEEGSLSDYGIRNGGRLLLL